jgi:hypothetical protein
MVDIWQLAASNWSPQCKVVINSAIIHILYAIWTTRNNVRFNDAIANWRTSVSWITACVTSAGNHTNKVSSSALKNFITLKRFKFNVNIHHPKSIRLKEVIWQPPLVQWVKCNTDGASTLISSACGGIFRDSNAEFLCGFAENTGTSSAFIAELCGATWSLRNRWKNCLSLTQNMNFIVSHVFREGNSCADGLVNVGLSLDRLTFWNEIPLVIKEIFEANRIGKPLFRVVHI